MAKKTLTETIRKSVARPDPTRKREEISDLQVPTLTLRINKGGATWQVRKMSGGRELKETIGNALDLTVEHARTIAKAAETRHKNGFKVDATWLERQRIELGLQHDPMPAKSLPRVRAKTWAYEEAVKAYLTSRAEVLKPATIKNYREVLNNPGLIDAFGKRAVADIDEAYAMRVVERIGGEHPSMAESIVRVIKPFWRWLLKSRREESGVTGLVMDDLRAPSRPRNKPAGHTVKRPELDDLAYAVAVCRHGDILHPTVALAIEACIYTGQRRETICTARVDDVHIRPNRDMPHWDIPAEGMKGGQRHAIPLIGRALEIFEEARRRAIEEGSEWLFPQVRVRRQGEEEKMSHISVHTLSHDLQHLAGFSPHRVRLAFGSTYRQMMIGSTEDVAMILDHREGRKKVTELHYNHDKMLPMKSYILRSWEPLLEPYVQAEIAALDPDDARGRLQAARRSRQKNPKKKLSPLRAHYQNADRTYSKREAAREAVIAANEEDIRIQIDVMKAFAKGDIRIEHAMERLRMGAIEFAATYAFLGFDPQARDDLLQAIRAENVRPDPDAERWAAFEKNYPDFNERFRKKVAS